jgi:putative heme iron utilization protein
MTPGSAQVDLRALIAAQPLAALATLHDGAPAVSMVPYALLPDATRWVIHVSDLASHTRDMLATPEVALLVIAPPRPGISPQETPRVSISGRAEPCPREAADYAAARGAYLARFPDSEPMFGFADFRVMVIRPTGARWVAGFARAASLAPADLEAALRA